MTGKKKSLNLYKGQRKPVQNDTDASTAVLSCPLSLPSMQLEATYQKEVGNKGRSPGWENTECSHPPIPPV